MPDEPSRSPRRVDGGARRWRRVRLERPGRRLMVRLEAVRNRLLLAAGSLTALSDQAADGERTRAEPFLVALLPR